MKTVKTKIEFMTALQKELERFGVADKNEILADFELHFGDSTKQGLSEAEICEKLGDIIDIAGQYAEEDVITPVFPDPVIPEFAAARETFAEKNISAEADISAINEADAVVKTDTGPLVLDDFGDAKEIEELIKAAPVHPDAENKSLRNEETAETIKNDAVYTSAETVQSNNNNKSYNGSNGWKTFSSNSMQINIGGLIGVLCVDLFVLSWALPGLFSAVVGLLSIPIALIGSGAGMVVDGVLKTLNIASIFNTWGTNIFGGISSVLLGVVLLCLGGLCVLLAIKLVKLCIKIVKSIINWHGKMIVGKTVFKDKNHFAK